MKAVPVLTLKRLPQYLEVLHNLQKEGLEIVSATKIAELTGVHMTQVRKDLAFTGAIGVPKVGHKIDELKKAIELFLNWNDATTCFLVGAGHLGKALLGYQELTEKGLKIIAAFDNDETKFNTTVNGTTIFPLSKFENLAKRLKVHIGIITVPKASAQETADLMVANGIIAIWNFTPVSINVPEDIFVENIDMSASLAVLSRRVAEKLTDREQD
jgi:redox-sensing transcriptional repressor